MTSIQRVIESVISFSRWLVVPILLGLVVGLGVLVVKFAVHLWEVIEALPSARGSDVIVGVLTLADFALTANLLLIIIFSSYSNFVRKLDRAQHPEWPAWMTEVDFSATKQKLLGTVVVIGVLAATEVYLDIESYKDTSRLAWLIGLLLTIVVATLGLALADRLGPSRDKE
jgi:uncharacterized protein (TIGR00645 family)